MDKCGISGQSHKKDSSGSMGYRNGYLFETISPLVFKVDTVQMALDFAKEGGGLGIAPMAISSDAAPITVSVIG